MIRKDENVNASDQFFAGGQSLNYGKDMRWQGRPRGGMVVSEPREEQQTDINTRQLLFWDAGRTQPKTQLVFTVVCDGSGPAAQNGWHTDERVDAQDRGHRDVYVKGKDKIDAIKAELARHGRPGIRIGDHYYECLTGERPGKTPGTTARTWAVMLFPGAGPEQTQFFGNEPQPPAQPVTNPNGFGQQPVNPTSTPAFPANHSPQGNAYGFGHQPPASPGGQAYAAAQQGVQGFGAPAPQYQQPSNPGPAPQWGAPPVQPSAPAGFGQAPPAAPQGFGSPPPPAQSPVPPADNPWGQAQPVQNPYG